MHAVNPHAIEGFAVMQTISVVALVVLSFGGSAVFLGLLDSFFGSAQAQRGQLVALQPRQALSALPVPRVVLLRTGLARQFEAFVADLSACNTEVQRPGEAESVIARHFSTIRARALELLADAGKVAEQPDAPGRED